MRLILSLLSLAIAGCRQEPPFVVECAINRHCQNFTRDPAWRCFFDGDTGGYCARPDASCPSGFRWAPFAPPNLADQCIDPALMPSADGGL